MPFHSIPLHTHVVQTHTQRHTYIHTIPYCTVPYRTIPYMYCIQTSEYTRHILYTPFIYIYIYSFFNTYETFPVEITSAHAREHLTHACATCASKERRARARRASKDRRAREVCEQGTRALRARKKAHISFPRVQISSPRLCLLAHLARARDKCSRARAAHPAAGEAPYMNSYV